MNVFKPQLEQLHGRIVASSTPVAPSNPGGGSVVSPPHDQAARDVMLAQIQELTTQYEAARESLLIALGEIADFRWDQNQLLELRATNNALIDIELQKPVINAILIQQLTAENERFEARIDELNLLIERNIIEYVIPTHERMIDLAQQINDLWRSLGASSMLTPGSVPTPAQVIAMADAININGRGREYWVPNPN